MNSSEPIGIIELGNINLKCLIFKINDDNSSEILAASITQSEGIHNGVIRNLKNATGALRLCMSGAEKKAKVSLKKINVILEQPEFLCTKFSKHRKINGSKIHKDDIEFLLKEGKKQVTLNDAKQSIIHIFNHNYIIDGKTFDEEPIDVYADNLSHEMTFVTMPKNNIKNINQVFIDCDIDVERFISCTFALGAELFNNTQLKFGSALINFGHEKISLGLFKNLALAHSVTIPVGINHIVKDISKVCLLTLEESKKIINIFDFSFKDFSNIFDKNSFLKEIYFTSSNFRKISESLVLNIIKSRIDEIFEIIKKQILITDLNPINSSGIFITGGGSNLHNLEDYSSKYFETKVVKFQIEQPDKEKKQVEDFAACFGALKIIKDGWETEAIPQRSNKFSEKRTFFDKIFRYRL